MSGGRGARVVVPTAATAVLTFRHRGGDQLCDRVEDESVGVAGRGRAYGRQRRGFIVVGLRASQGSEREGGQVVYPRIDGGSGHHSDSGSRSRRCGSSVMVEAPAACGAGPVGVRDRRRLRHIIQVGSTTGDVLILLDRPDYRLEFLIPSIEIGGGCHARSASPAICWIRGVRWCRTGRVSRSSTGWRCGAMMPRSRCRC